MSIVSPIKNVGRVLETASRTVVGNSPAELAFEGEVFQRTGVIIRNPDSTLSLYVCMYKPADGVPSIDGDTADFEITPRTTIELVCDHTVGLAAVNSAGDGTTSKVWAKEYKQ